MLLVELFKSSYPIDDYSYQDYRCTAYFKDAEGKRVSVVFTPLDETIHDEVAQDLEDEEQAPVSIWRIDFARNGEGSLLTSDAKDSVMIFSTIVNVLGEMLNHLKGRGIKPDIIMIGAMKQKGHDRPGFYKKMIERLASKYGYKPRIKPLVKASILSTMHANGFKLDNSVIQFASLA